MERESGSDTYECPNCKAKGYDKSFRYCWQDDKPRTVEFGDVPLSCTRETLRVLLPADDPLEYLLQRGCHIDGRMICPVPLATHPDLVTVLQLEADMTGGEGGWNLLPLSGPSSTWPMGFLAVLRHIRGVKGQLQQKAHKRMEAKAKEKG